MIRPFIARTLILFVALALPWTSISHAQQGHSRFVGANLGITSVSNDVGSGVAFGIEGGYFFLPYLGVKGFLRAGNHSNDITSFFFGIDGLYRFNPELTGLSVGLSLGSGKFSADGMSGNSALAYGIKTVYDYLLPNQNITLGAELSITWCEPGDTVLTNVSPLLTIKWWF
ncbi:hypothetical protein EBZ37_07665 [bacterium]|nr:hypothetical protein [bacterium]